MSLAIRAVQDTDFTKLTEIYNNHNEPDLHLTIEEFKQSHTSWLKHPAYQRVVTVVNDEPVAQAFRYSREGDKQGHYWIDVSVQENYRLTGLEKTMIDRLIEDCPTAKPSHLWNCIRSDFNRTVAFLSDYGFEEVFRSWGSHLDLTKFQLEAFQPHIESLESQGFRFLSYAALTDVAKEAKLLALHRIIEEDAPHYEPIIPKDREDIRSQYVPDEACFVALDGDKMIGMAGLDTEHGLQNSLTGVDRDYRSRGIATALKALVADYAKSHGEVDINAAGSGKNTPMLKVNVKLGYDIEPAWITSCAKL